MKLIFIYGPPASGKLTVAEKLSEQTGIPLFHNHLSRDLVNDIYGDALAENYGLVGQIRTNVFEYCAQKGTDLIFTFVYGGEADDDIVKDYIQSIEKYKGKVLFVELMASRDDLLKRVGNESRKRHKKLLDPDILSEITENMDDYSIPFVDAVKINTSSSSPEESAKHIAEKLNI